MPLIRKGERTKEAILLSAEKVFSEKGYFGTQVNDIIKLAHVAKGTVYEYFDHKEEIFITLLDRYLERWKSAVSLNLVEFTGEGPGIFYALDYVRQRFSKTAQYFSENQDRSNIILRMGPGLNVAIESCINAFEDSVLDVIKSDIELGQRFGHISKDVNLEIAGNVILGSVLRLSYYYFVRKKQSYVKLQIDGFIDELVKMVAGSLGMDYK